MYLCGSLCRCPQHPEIGYPGASVTGGCELPLHHGSQPGSSAEGVPTLKCATTSPVPLRVIN